MCIKKCNQNIKTSISQIIFGQGQAKSLKKNELICTNMLSK